MREKKEPAVKKNAAAQAMVALRNKKLTATQRKEIAKKAIATRWANKKKQAESGATK